MPYYYGQITGTDNGVEGTWFIELDHTGVPISEYVFIPVQTMPDVVPVWSIALPIGSEAGIDFSDDEAAEIGYLLMQRRMAELKGLGAGSGYPCYPSDVMQPRMQPSPSHQ